MAAAEGALERVDEAPEDRRRGIELDGLRILGRSALVAGEGEVARRAFGAILALEPGDAEGARVLGRR